MSELTIKASKFTQLLEYLAQIELDAEAVAQRVNISAARLRELDSSEPLPALQYARLYRAAVKEMQNLRHPIPWGAGVGSDAFEFMCRSIITERTLGDALGVAERYDKMMYPMIGYRVSLLDDGESSEVRLRYHVAVPEEESVLAPSSWDRSGYQETVARSSGLEVWCAFCGWLTGQPMELESVSIAAPFLNQAYCEGLANVFRCPIHFDADDNCLSFDREQLHRRVVHTGESLAEFLDNSIYHLIAVDRSRASTSAAIKSLISIDLPGGLPSFTAIARSLHMSESSLRRRLQSECTSYQALKDEVRCEVAIDKL
ncbi:MAG: AraC family transcriptional regulator ligand-binding domain-containing protein, partial [Thiohalobacterales bacterium]|nr:AraC family transcriptional regulator ligand-binding domain-containing protein [Thiohalobacterales bacterium]